MPNSRLYRLRSSLIGGLTIAFLIGPFNPVTQQAHAQQDPNDAEVDIVIYGGTSAGIIAAVQARQMGKRVVIVCPDKHLGGLTSGGLGWTDTGNKGVIGGLSREFYHRVWKHYQRPEAWRWQDRAAYGNRGQGTPAIDGAQRTMWIFEPHVAEQVYEDFVKEYDIPVHRDQWLDREGGVKKSGTKIESIRTRAGKTWRGRIFIDATYEGDLMAAAGLSFNVGRESSDRYGEKWNGVQTGVLHHRHHFGVLKHPIDPYVVSGDPSSGLLPRINADPPGEYGQADRRIQAYCFRMCLTKVPRNRVAFAQPEGYDASQYELLLRVFDAGWREQFHKFDPIPNGKTDTNNHGPFSTDNIGYNYDYPEGTYEQRREIIREHEQYQKGLMYFMANDPRVPEDVRNAMQQWGLAKDEFVDNGHWPHQIYVREARRLVGQYIMTENELLKRRPTPNSIGMGSYNMDSHNVQRYITPEGQVQNEGDIGVKTNGPYQIALGSIIPQSTECTNLLVPVCVSSSHIAFGSIRMEPVFMILGQSAATLASLSIDRDLPVQEVEYAVLREQLIADGQVLEAPPTGQNSSASSTKQQQAVEFPAEQWQRRSPAELGLKSDKLGQIAEYLDGHGMITKNGYHVYSWGDITRAADIASAVKPFYTHFLMAAVELDRLKSVDQRLAEFEPRLTQINQELAFKDTGITFRHCANQTSCYGVAESPGTAFDYNDFQMALFFDTLFEQVYKTPREEIDVKILRRLLTEPLHCQDSPSFMAFGDKNRAGRLRISPRDFCRFGLLYLREGRWNDRQLLTPDNVRRVTRSPLPVTLPRTTAQQAEMVTGQRSIGSQRIPDDQTEHLGSYSWLWWVNGQRQNGKRLWPDAPADVFACLGHKHGKRGMAVIPSWNIVLSWNDSALDSKAWEDQQSDPHPLNVVFRLLDESQVH